jgi:hypothetical protein
LITVDCLTVAGAKSRQEIEESFVFHLALTKLDEVDNSFFGNLLIQKDLIVFEQFSDSRLSLEIILFGCSHGLVEVKFDELCNVELVIVIVFHTMLKQSVNKLTDSCDGVFLGEIAEMVKLILEWVLQNID